MTIEILWYSLAVLVALAVLRKLQLRLQLSRAKHRSLVGHARMSRRFAALVPFYEYGADEFFRADGAPDAIAATRRAGFERLTAEFRRLFPKSARQTAEVQETISDLQFTSRYRVPFQFSRYVRERLRGGAFLECSSGVTFTDLDGNRFYDLTGSYGVNVFGYDFYKECIERGSERVRDLGPVLGAYHPVAAYNVGRLRADLRSRRGLLPHVGNGGRDAGGAAGPLPHEAQVPGALLRRVPRLVGRRAAGCRQSARRPTIHTR